MHLKTAVLFLTHLLLVHTIRAASSTSKTCTLPAAGEDFQEATPAQVKLNQTAVNKAITYANTHGRISVQIFRHNCRVAAGLLDPITDSGPNNVFSVTKSVVSLLTGIAHQHGKLRFEDQIGQYLPNAPGWGNKKHRALTIEQLLTETAGFTEAILAEGGTVGTDSSAPQEALAQPFTHKPGTHFEYSQRVPDLLAYVVQRAVGQDLQAFAQKYLFDPIGIPKDSYFWLRDRSGDTYGYAFLFIPPTQLAKLGLLAQNDGAWNGKQVVSQQYITAMSSSSERNPCYGYLFWLNKNKPCTGANIPDAQTYQRYLLPSAPRDLYAMIGALHQNNFIIPSLGMTVTWSGAFGDTEPNLSALLSASSADLYDNFFRLLLAGVEDAKVPHPGPFKPDPLDLDVNPFNYLSPTVALHDINANPHCNILFCRGGVPSKGSIQNLQAIAQTILGFIP